MIEDIEGATSEPARRRHVMVLSGAIAVASLVLLLSLVVPAPLGTLPHAASPAPSPSAETLMIFAPSPISQMRVDLSRAVACADGTRLSPPYFLSVDGSTRAIWVGAFDERSGAQIHSPIPVTFRFDARTGWMTVTCATDDDFVPWDKVAR